MRDDGPAAQAAIHALYRHEVRLSQNLFLPSVKLLDPFALAQAMAQRLERSYALARL